MSAVLKLMLRVFFVTGAAFGVLMGLIAGFAVSRGDVIVALLVGLGVAAIAGTFFGLAMTILSGGWHVWVVWRLGYRLTDETLSVRQRRLLTVETPYSEAFTLCLAAVRYLGGSEVEEETDFGTGVILASKRVSWWGGMGEQIRFDLRGGGGRTEVEVTCRPRVRTVLVDGGVSLRNMDAIIGFLLAHGGRSDGALALKRSEHVRASTDRVEDRPPP